MAGDVSGFEGVRLGTTDRRLDVGAIETGVPVECPLRPGLTVSILPAAMFSSRFRKALQHRIEALSGANGDATELGRYQDPAFVVDALVSDMAGITRADGTEISYTPELGRAVLSDPGNADVLEWVANVAMDMGQFYTQQVEEDEKNS